MRKLLTGVVLLLFVVRGLSQDHVYSQFYNAPNYLNPALNGQFEGDLRVNLIHRSQWTNLPGPLNYYSFSVDYNVPQFGGGVGLLASRSSEGTAFLKKTSLSGIYSYSIDFEEAVLSFGIQAGFVHRKIDYKKLVYYDQLDKDGIIPGGISDASAPALNNRFYFDSGAGINLVFYDAMIGGSVQHINKPDESFTGNRSLLPMRLNGHASYRINLDYYGDEGSPLLIPSVLVYNQAKLTSVSAGLQFKTRRVNLGVWYRGEPKQSDAIVFSLSLDVFDRRDSYDKVRVGISHDAATSKLSYGKTAGSTEGAITWETTFPNSDGEKRYSFGKRCYDFY
jgi:type IX secretion system PorP/SprF family membrane protein